MTMKPKTILTRPSKVLVEIDAQLPRLLEWAIYKLSDTTATENKEFSQLVRIHFEMRHDPQPVLCHCDLSGEVELIRSGGGCEIHQPASEHALTPHGINNIAKFYTARIEQLTKSHENARAQDQHRLLLMEAALGTGKEDEYLTTAAERQHLKEWANLYDGNTNEGKLSRIAVIAKRLLHDFATSRLHAAEQEAVHKPE